MKLVRITPELGGLPELATFQCPNCEEVTTIENGEIGQAFQNPIFGEIPHRSTKKSA
jgi:hypothetical protein